MHTCLCLQFDPQQIATACVYLACNFAKTQPSGGKSWLEVMGHPDAETLASVSLQILELIAGRDGSDVATIAKIRKYLDQLKDQNSTTKPPSDDSRNDDGHDGKRQRIV
jgi:hypothetical protein